MSIEQYFVSQQLCWDCANAYGGCPWTEVDTDTKRVKFQPVPGWDAKKVIRRNGSDRKGNKRISVEYAIKDCPMFEEE